MPLHPAAQQMIRKVEALSGRPVHVAEDPDLKVMAVITTARVSAPAQVDIGFDLSAEYAAARAMFGAGQ